LILPLVLLVKTLQSVFDIISNLNPLPRELHGLKYAKLLQMGPGKELRDS